MLTKKICTDDDRDDKRAEQHRYDETPPTPWIPPVKDPNTDICGNPIKPKKKRRSRSMWS